MAAFDVENPESIVSPGGVGFDINCGVRLLRTNLTLEDLDPVKSKLCDVLFQNIPVGVGTRGEHNLSGTDVNRMIEMGMEWSVEKGISWPEDLPMTEENGKIKGAKALKVSAKARGRAVQLGTLGSGNHYVEVQAVEDIFDFEAAKLMGFDKIGQICIMIHCGSRGFGHQVASEFVNKMQEITNQVLVNDPQLACVPISSEQGQSYLESMAAAANFAFVNRSAIAEKVRKSFETVFSKSAREMDMHQVYDVAHNIATFEEHWVESEQKIKRLLVHRKGSSRAYPPNHPALPDIYKACGQPILIGGSMGTCSYIMTGTEAAMRHSFGSTCHGAGRALSRTVARKSMPPEQVIQKLENMGICLRVASPDLIAEEAPESYKDVNQVVNICHASGLGKKTMKVRPVAVIKG